MKMATPPMALEFTPKQGRPTTEVTPVSNQRGSKSRGLAGYVVSAPILAACALALAACGGAAQMMDGTPHAESISPTVAVPEGASTDYRSAQVSGGEGEEPLVDAGLADNNDGNPVSGAPVSAEGPGTGGADDGSGDDGQVAAMPDPDADTGAAGSGMAAAEGGRLTERGFFGIAEPIRRAEQPAAAAPQPRQPTQQESQSRARRDALASIVGQFDSPSSQGRPAAAPDPSDQEPRMADVPDRPDDAPTEEELASMRAQLESSREGARSASQGRADRIEAEAEADDPFSSEAPDENNADEEPESESVELSDPAAMMGGEDTETDSEPTSESLASTVTIPFEAGSADLGGDSRRMVTDLAGDPTLQGASIRVVGYATEDDGGEATAQSRASAVADALNGALASADVSGVSVQVETAVSPADASADQASRVDVRINE